MPDDDYLSLLERAKVSLPETIEKHERFKVPEPDIFLEGKITVVRNFGAIIDALRREPEHLLQYLLRELGTPGFIEGQRLVLKAKLTPAQVADRIMGYTDTFVLCSECGRPDTRIVKEGRILVLECDACGAHRPVHVRRSVRTSEDEGIKEGGVYEVMVEDVGRKGDGVAKLDKYVIYVPGAARGARVKVKIQKISGNVAFAVQSQEDVTK
ncbi:translation initiation factor IF-2 subunit beta [Methanomassiliicoccus luminyensis]|jgi:translation initiation factor 2 subunit 2|uniref:translation initiation factor IF-2 subunit beta n=1 Tax=Methanomassiliicoccus luminyensis TaxID=1080712 RepID=UPI0003660635|nr:translation initiation factor IF-2 subunit beta [Methanomassiliicoccus luminyensis]